MAAKITKMTQKPRMLYGPIAMQKRRLAQVEALIEQYDKLISETGDRQKFGVALERAVQQKRRIQNWLGVHEPGRRSDTPPEKFLRAPFDVRS